MLKVSDGDTLVISADLGFKIRHEIRVRLAGVNVPELATEDGRTGRQWVVDWFTAHPGPYTVHTIRDRTEKYGRYLAHLQAADGRELNADLLTAGIASPYPPR